MTWQVHVYGTPRAELSAWCADRGMSLHVFAWRPEHEAAGLARDALYLLRPDTYVALADSLVRLLHLIAISLIEISRFARRHDGCTPGRCRKWMH